MYSTDVQYIRCSVYQVGNNGSHKNTVCRQPRLALGWATIRGSEVDVVAKKYRKIPEAEKRGGASMKCFWVQKININKIYKKQHQILKLKIK